jgi:hypothetical protein
MEPLDFGWVWEKVVERLERAARDDLSFPPQRMQLVPVSTLVNSPRNESPDCVKPARLSRRSIDSEGGVLMRAVPLDR